MLGLGSGREILEIDFGDFAKHNVYPTGSIPKGLGSNEVHRIHEQYALEVLLSSGVAGSKGWLVGC